jgi:hypothetical protein
MDESNSLPKFLATLIQSHKYGGRTVRTDEKTVVLYDCGVWSDAHSSAVRDKFPECEVNILQSSASLSGFIVVVKIHNDSYVYSWGTVLLGVFISLILTGRQMLGNAQ